MQWIRRVHELSADDYDRIAGDFVGMSPMGTLRNIYNLLKRNTRYQAEGKDEQTVKLPGAILVEGRKRGIDCKNYALFIGGVLDAINRSGYQYIPFFYRFASYDWGIEEPGHVYVVAMVDGKEVWVDPVFKTFDKKVQPLYFIDKKIKTMALKVIAGPGRRMNGPTDITSAGDSSGGQILQAAVPALTDLFGSLFGGSKPNPNDWKGWTDNAARYWTHIDGDSVPNEAGNIVSYIKNKGLDNMGWLLDIMDQSPPVTPAILYRKLNAGGLGQLADYLSAKLQWTLDGRNMTPSSAATLATIAKYEASGSAGTGTGGGVTWLPGTTDTGSGNTALYIGGAAAAALLLYFMFKKK
jgi:LPXTG-motif cell wall-anchored protein